VAPVVGSGGACVWQESGFSRREDVFTLIYFVKKCYKFCTSNAICKDNAAIKCITFQHKRRFIPVDFDGPYYSSQIIIILPKQLLDLHALCCVREYLFQK
jgi:hypothetical protein